MIFSLQKTWKKFLKDLLGEIIKCALCTKALCQTNPHKKKTACFLRASCVVAGVKLPKNAGEKFPLLGI